MQASSLLAPPAQRLKGKVALITGGASGIGAATARIFLQHGAKVVIADIQDDLGHSVCSDVGSDDSISYVHCDVRSETEVQAAVSTAVSKYGKLDVLFGNAGILGKVDASIDTIDYDNFKRVIDINVYGAVLSAKYAAKVMIPEKKGSIIFTSSIVSVINGNSSHAYVASKYAVVGLTKKLCVELGKYGIRVNCISPYTVATPMVEKETGMRKDEVERVYSEAANLKEVILEDKDVGEAALYLASDESKYVSGLNLVVDGGYSTTNPSMVESLRKFRQNITS